MALGGDIPAGAVALGLAGSILLTLAGSRLSDRRVHWWFRPLLGSLTANRILFYAGVAMLVAGWLWLGRALRTRGPAPRTIALIALLWCLPLLLGAPLFSHDVYSYFAQGTIARLGLNPYRAPPTVLAPLGHGQVLQGVDPFWRRATAPYGPLFIGVIGLLSGLAGSHLVLGALAVRLFDFLGWLLLAAFVPRLARRTKADPSRAAWLALASPLVLLQLVAPAHNDLLMAGLMLAGVTLALERRPLLGIVVCTLAATVKLPALAAVGFITVAWMRAQPGWRSALRSGLVAAAATVATAGAITLITGFGAGWISSGLFSTPARVRLAITPATALSYTLAHLVSGLSYQDVIPVLRALLVAAAALSALVLLLRSRFTTLVSHLGLALAAFAVGGPALWPWYLSWGLVLIAAWRAGQRSPVVSAVVVVGSFLVKPDGILLLSRGASPVLAGIWLAIAAAGWLAWRRRSPRPAQLAPAQAVDGQPGEAAATAGSSRALASATAPRSAASATVPRSAASATAPRSSASASALRLRALPIRVRLRVERRLDAAVIAGPALLGLLLCLYQLTARSLWLDESASFSIASQHGAAFGAAVAHDGGNMLAYYALLHVLIGWFGAGALVLRLPAALSAAATVAAVAALGRRLASRRVALFSGLLTAVSLSLVYWGQDARGYAPMVALIALSFLSLVGLVEGRRPGLSWVAYVLSTTGAVYMGLEAALIVPAQLVALLWFRARRPAVVSGMALSALACIPLAVLAAERGSGQLFWVPSPSLRVLGQVAQALASSGLQPAFYTSSSAALAILTGIVLAAGALLAWGPVGIGRGRRPTPAAADTDGRGGGPTAGAAADTDARGGGPTPVLDADRGRRLEPVAGANGGREFVPAPGGQPVRWPPALMFAWLLVPAVLALLESAVGHSIFQARYLLVSLPAVSLLLGWTLAHPRVPRLLSLGLLAALLALRALQLAPAYGVSSENWRAATHFVVAHTRPGDCIAFYPLDNRQAFRYYLPIGPAERATTRLPRPILPTLPWRFVRPFVEDYRSLSAAQVAALPARCSRVWLLASHEGRVGGPPVSRANYARFLNLERGLTDGYPRATSREFGQAGVVTLTLYAR